MNAMRVKCRWLTLLAGLALPCQTTLADDAADFEQARRLVEEGRILPLQQILAAARTRTPGRLIEAELELEQGRWIYEFEFIERGEVWEYRFDAATGRFLERESD